MKLLNDIKIEPKEELTRRILAELVGTKVSENKIREIISNYEVMRVGAIGMGIPDFVYEGANIHITREIGNWDYTGEVKAIWYKGYRYSWEQIAETLSNVLFSNETAYHMTIYEETKPYLYHRIVLNTPNKGILIVPLVDGTKIERVINND